ncbi:MAG: hypothetical protein ACUVV0_01110 [Anaerolineae bacterium]
MSGKWQDRIAYYRALIQGLDDDDYYDTDALLALVERDEIEDHWAELTPEEREEVLALDQELARRHDRVAVVLPNANSVDRQRWWWFLHEGPQVREEALSYVS